jgi:hypothetical protein
LWRYREFDVWTGFFNLRDFERLGFPAAGATAGLM